MPFGKASSLSFFFFFLILDGVLEHYIDRFGHAMSA
jgi:hypothetical protein